MNTPQRIELPNGCYWQAASVSDESGFIYNSKGAYLTDIIGHVEAVSLAAAMRNEDIVDYLINALEEVNHWLFGQGIMVDGVQLPDLLSADETIKEALAKARQYQNKGNDNIRALDVNQIVKE